MLPTPLLIVLGGGIGALLRYGLGQMLTSVGGFPWTTLLVNVLGSLCLGLVFGYAEGRGAYGSALYLLLGVGFCGGFTTFSTFSLEGLKLLEAGEPLLYALYIAASVGGGLLAVTLGYLWAR